MPASRIASDLGNEPNAYRTYDRFDRNIASGAGNFYLLQPEREVDMALGNAIGSNIFNILMVLGVASAISPISIIKENIIDMCVLIVFTVCVWIFAGTKKKNWEDGRFLYGCVLFSVCGVHHNKMMLRAKMIFERNIIVR